MCSYSSALRLCQSPSILCRGHELFPSPASPSRIAQATKLDLVTFAINPTGLSQVTVCLLKTFLLPSAGHSEDLVTAGGWAVSSSCLSVGAHACLGGEVGFW